MEIASKKPKLSPRFLKLTKAKGRSVRHVSFLIIVRCERSDDGKSTKVFTRDNPTSLNPMIVKESPEEILNAILSLTSEIEVDKWNRLNLCKTLKKKDKEWK